MSDDYEALRELAEDIGRAVRAAIAVALIIVLVLVMEVRGYGLAFVDWVRAWML